jgi:hypothetical protein
MEQTGLKPAVLKRNRPDSNSDLSDKIFESKAEAQLVFEEATEVAGDWLEATGGIAINDRQYALLFEAGYASHPPDKLLRIFHDWKDFQQVSQTFFEDKQTARAGEDQHLLDAVEEERRLGMIPDDLFKQTESYTGRYCKVGDEHKGKVYRIVRYEQKDDEVDETKLLERYARFSVAKYLSRFRAPGQDISEDRLVNISLGFSRDSGKGLSSFYGALKNSIPDLSELDIELAAEELGLYRHMYAESRRHHFETLLQAGSEEFYDLKRKRLVGKTAVISYTKGAPIPDNVERVGHLLTTPDFDGYGLKRHKKEVSKANREDCLKYGRWLIGLVKKETGLETLNEEILRRAYVMRLGIGPNHIVHPLRFNSSTEFYSELGLTRAKRVKLFHEHSIDDFASMISELGDKLGRKPTEEDINNASKENPHFPSAHIIQGRGYELRDVYEVAGWPNIYSWGLGDHEIHGVKFMLANSGLEPSQRAWDMLSKAKRGPSASIIRFKYENGFEEFKQNVRRLYSELKEIEALPDEFRKGLEALKMPDNFMTHRRKSLIKRT